MVNNALYYPHAIRVLDEVQKTGGAIELNTAGWFKECNEQYPCCDLLKEALERKIPVVVNADAHHQDHVMRNFAESARILAESGYPAR